MGLCRGTKAPLDSNASMPPFMWWKSTIRYWPLVKKKPSHQALIYYLSHYKHSSISLQFKSTFSSRERHQNTSPDNQYCCNKTYLFHRLTWNHPDYPVWSVHEHVQVYCAPIQAPRCRVIGPSQAFRSPGTQAWFCSSLKGHGYSPGRVQSWYFSCTFPILENHGCALEGKCYLWWAKAPHGKKKKKKDFLPIGRVTWILNELYFQNCLWPAEGPWANPLNSLCSSFPPLPVSAHQLYLNHKLAVLMSLPHSIFRWPTGEQLGRNP